MKKGRILIVEDQAVIAESIREMLIRSGYRNVDIAIGADEAKRMFEAKNYTILLVDIDLGAEKDGIDLVASLNGTRKVPVIYLTGKTDRATMWKARITMPGAYLTKPVTESQLQVQLSLYMQANT